MARITMGYTNPRHLSGVVFNVLAKEAFVIALAEVKFSLIVAMTAKLPFLLQLVKFIPNFTPARAITCTNEKSS